MRLWKSALFTPGTDQNMIKKSTALYQDLEIIDLEDSVQKLDKEIAREILRKLVRKLSWKNADLCIRINNPYTSEGLRDLLLVSDLDYQFVIMIPKASPGIQKFTYKITGREVIPLIESAQGVTAIEDIVREEGVIGVAWGNADLALNIGGSTEVFENTYVRQMLPIYARSYGISSLDKVFFKIHSPSGLKRDTMIAKSYGYTGKMVIHPDHVSIVNETFSPTVNQLNWAESVVKVYADVLRKRSTGVTVLNGEMIDKVQFELAKSILRNRESSSYHSDSKRA